MIAALALGARRLSFSYDMPRRTKSAVVQFFVAGDEYTEAGRSADCRAQIEIEIEIGIEVRGIKI